MKEKIFNKEKIKRILGLVLVVTIVFVMTGCAGNFQGYADSTKSEVLSMTDMPTSGYFTFDLTEPGEAHYDENSWGNINYSGLYVVDLEENNPFDRINDKSTVVLTVPEKTGAWVKLENEGDATDVITCTLSVEGFSLGTNYGDSSIQIIAKYSGAKLGATYKISIGGFMGVYDESGNLNCLLKIDGAEGVIPPNVVVTKQAIHKHDWKYSVGIGNDANKITAKCEGDEACTVINGKTDGVTLTLLANNANYSGDAVEASISSTEIAAWEEADLTVPEIKYFGRGGTADPANNAAPKEVGKYTAKITLDNIVFATKDFEIIDPNAGGKVTIHRYLRPDKKDWLITCNEKEIENLKAAGWNDEGALGVAGTKDTGVEVIRFYNEITGDRMYTSNEKEKQNYRDAKKYGWIEEGVAFYTGKNVEVVRFRTPYGSHIWSTSKEEINNLDIHFYDGWKKEGVAFYLN